MPDESAAQLETFDSVPTLCLGAAERIAHAARAAVYSRKRFRIVLSGGEPLGALYRLLADDYRERIQWPQVIVFFADEQCVPGPSAEGNYAMAAGALFSRVPIAKRNEHRLAGELDAEDEARSYEKMLRREAPPGTDAAFDLLILNVGADGSVASLFPGSAALDEPERWVMPVRAPAAAPTPARITMTPPILGRAREVLMVAAGSARSELAGRIVRGDPAAARLPAGRIRGMERTVWMACGKNHSQQSTVNGQRSTG
jgi:6-phosphogluconolactonase